MFDSTSPEAVPQQRLPRENAYECPKCRALTVTVDVDEGVTPAFLRCRATNGCTGMAASNFYPRCPRPARVPPPAWEWYAPADVEIATLDPSTRVHERGGLLIRARTDREPRYHDDPAPPRKAEVVDTSNRAVDTSNRAERRARLRANRMLPSQKRRRA